MKCFLAVGLTVLAFGVVGCSREPAVKVTAPGVNIQVDKGGVDVKAPGVNVAVPK